MAGWFGGRVGIFWCVEGEPLFRAREAHLIEPLGGLRALGIDHATLWMVFTRTIRPRLHAYPHDHFPRGRVMFREADARFLIHVDPCLLDADEFLIRLRTAFGLLASECTLHPDPQYRCPACPQ